MSRLQYRHRVFYGLEFLSGVMDWSGTLDGADRRNLLPTPSYWFRWHFQFYFVKKEIDKADVFSTSLFSLINLFLHNIGKCHAFGTLSGIHFTPHDGFMMASRYRQVFAYHSHQHRMKNYHFVYRS